MQQPLEKSGLGSFSSHRFSMAPEARAGEADLAASTLLRRLLARLPSVLDLLTRLFGLRREVLRVAQTELREDVEDRTAAAGDEQPRHDPTDHIARLSLPIPARQPPGPVPIRSFRPQP